MSLAHPRTKLAPTADPRRILCHPVLEVFGAYPTWVQLAECGEEGLGLGLELWGGLCGVCGGDGVQKRPRGAPEGFDVGWTVGGKGWDDGGRRRRGGGLDGFGSGFGFTACHGEP